MSREIMWKRYKDTPIMVSEEGVCYNLKVGKFVGSYTPKGYRRCTYRIGAERKMFLIHRAVAELFIPNPDFKEQVNHKDLVKDNNKVENLEWCTRLENLQHSWDNGRKRWGSSHGSSLFSEQQVFDIKNLKEFFTCKELATYYGVSKSTIKAICNGQNWSQVRKNDPGLSLSVSMEDFRKLVKEELKKRT